MIIGDFLINLAASLAYSLLSHFYQTKLTDPQRQVLEKVYTQGFAQMLRSSRLELNQEQSKAIGDVLTAFISQTGTAGAYLDLALHNEQPNLEALSQQFRAFDGPAKLQGTGFDFERGMVFFYHGLTEVLIKEASQFNSPLANLVTVNQNRAVLQSLDQIRQIPQSFAESAQPTSASEYHRCFISYAHQDQNFVDQLYNDLRQVGVNCWYAPEDLAIGARIRQTIDDAIHGYDKLLLVLSEHSVASAWVEKEVETAFEREQQQGSGWVMLFPIQLDDTVMHTRESWAADIRRMRMIGDFSQWQTPTVYQTQLRRLLRDLKWEEKRE